MSGPNEDTPVSYLEITNGLDFEIEMFFHGDRYLWAPGESVNCTTDAAAHIFGFGLPKEGVQSRTAAFHRLGWISTAPGCDYKSAMAKLAKISFKGVEQVFQMPTAEERQERKARGKRKNSGNSDRLLTETGTGGGGAEEISDAPSTPEDEPIFEAADTKR